MSGGGGGKAGGKSGGGTKVTDYNMSLHYGFCLGPVDVVRRIFIGEKDIDADNAGVDLTPPAVTANGIRAVNKPGLFGGAQQGGGVGGRINFLLGAATQLAPIELAARLSKTVETMPAFRNIFSLLFTGDRGDANAAWYAQDRKKGFYWGTNNPSLPSVWCEVSCWPKVLDNDSAIGLDANPAHIIYESLVSTEWGLGLPTFMIDIESFTLAASTLRTEVFGLSLSWSASTPIESFIREILDHIGAMLAVDPTSGQLYLKLIRDDYDHDTVIEINPGNAKISRLQLKNESDTINEIIVTWTNPENEQEETVTFHDNANIEMQGQVVSDGRNYYGVRNVELATKLAARDLRNNALPLISCDAEGDRRFWSVKPGDVVRLAWPEEGIASVLMRVGACDYGGPGSPRVKMSLVQDAAAFSEASFTAPGTEWEDPSSDIGPLDFLHLDSVGYFMTARTIGDDQAQAVEYPNVNTLIFAAQIATDVRSTDVLAKGYDVVGNLGFYPAGTVANQGHAYLASAIAIEEVTDIWPLDSYVGFTPTAGMLVVFIDGVDQEVCAIESTTTSVEASSLIIRRGCLDTVPQTWAIGTEVWILETTQHMGDTVQRTVGEVVEYKFLPISSRGQVPVEDVTIEAITLTDRFYRPYRPANVRVNDTLFGPLSVRVSSTVTVTWSRRNRLSETAQILRWTEADVTPETGQTTTVELWRGVTLLDTFSGIAGTSQAIDLSDYGAVIVGDMLNIRLYSERDGYESYDVVDYGLTISGSTGGYGLNADLSYGRI